MSMKKLDRSKFNTKLIKNIENLNIKLSKIKPIYAICLKRLSPFLCYSDIDMKPGPTKYFDLQLVNAPLESD